MATPSAARVKAAMGDDFNTPEAGAVLFELAGEVNKSKSAQQTGLLKALGATLGLLQRDPESYLQSAAVGSNRTAARAAKDFAESDRIRKTLLDGGIVLEDTAQGTSWRRN